MIVGKKMVSNCSRSRGSANSYRFYLGILYFLFLYYLNCNLLAYIFKCNVFPLPSYILLFLGDLNCNIFPVVNLFHE